MLEYVHDIHDPRLAPFAGMRDAQLRGDEGAGPGLFIGESDKVINRALDAGVRPSCLFMEEKWVEKTRPLIDRIDAAPDGRLRVVDYKTGKVPGPRYVDEALYQMELVGHPFYLFIERATKQPCAVYHRHGWTYGVIRLDAQVM